MMLMLMLRSSVASEEAVLVSFGRNAVQYFHNQDERRHGMWGSAFCPQDQILKGINTVAKRHINSSTQHRMITKDNKLKEDKKE